MTKRVLNLLDQPEGTGRVLTLKLSADLAKQEQAGADVQHAWLLIGGEPIREAAFAAGLPASRIRLFPMSAGVRSLVPRSLGSVKRLLDQADRVDCWTVGAARLASSLGCSNGQPRFGQATLSPPARHAVRPSAQALIANKPAVRRAARERWGVPEEAVMIGLLADVPERVDTRDVLLASLFAHETFTASDPPCRDLRMVCHPSGLGRISAVELAELLESSHKLVQDAALLEPWSSLLGLDLVIAPDPMLAPLSLVWAQALGLPIIAPPAPRLIGFDAIDGLNPIPSSAPRHLAKGITDWAMSQPPAPLMVTA